MIYRNLGGIRNIGNAISWAFSVKEINEQIKTQTQLN